MRYADLAAASLDIVATRRRIAKIERLAGLLRETEIAFLPVVVAHLSGRLPQGRIGVGHSLLRGLRVSSAAAPSLTVAEVDAMLSRLGDVAGPGSKAARISMLEDLFSRATQQEQDLVLGLLAGGIRQGALDGVMGDAIALAFGVDAGAVRRAAMLSGDLGAAAVAAATGGEPGLAAFRLRVFQPLQPMLASTAESVAAAIEAVGDAVVDWKLDGARIQIHSDGTDVRAYTRNLRDVTSRLPETVASIAELGVSSVVLDAEVISVLPDGRPRPFQETMSRFGRHGDEPGPDGSPLSTFVFDALHIDGDDLIDVPLTERILRLEAILTEGMSVPRLRTSQPSEAEEFFEAALAAGHEGVVVKAARSPYAAGRRGSDWLKIKPAHTLDLVVLAAEWGSGRRQGWLSNLHLGAYDPAGDRFVMLGKTFKGLTDEMLEWQTQRFLELETRREGHVVYVAPSQIVEIAFDGVQESRRYPAGMALRFARVKGFRNDKDAAEADTVATVRDLLRRSRRSG